MRTHARAPAVAAVTPLAIMLADARAPAVLAVAPLAVMRADARAPAVLATAPDAVEDNYGGFVAGTSWKWVA